jgi:hypothetical protein
VASSRSAEGTDEDSADCVGDWDEPDLVCGCGARVCGSSGCVSDIGGGATGGPCCAARFGEVCASRWFVVVVVLVDEDGIINKDDEEEGMCSSVDESERQRRGSWRTSILSSESQAQA